MEIISVPIKGALEHKDSMGNIAAIHEGEIQVMSAGTGIYHSEYNKYKDKSAEFLQIWVFPKAHNVKPRYDQQKFGLAGRKNQWQNIVAPMEAKDSGVKIHQDAWFHLGDLQAGKKLQYDIHLKTNGLYVFVIEGKVKVAGQDLDRRDGLGIWDVAKVDFEASSDAQLLLMEVPMNLPRY
jgi:redox-sensitive bicupin YhaK (pirin superfamily)